MTEPTGNDPFEEGLEAFGRGVARSDCPYPEGNDERERWLDGWDEGADLDEEGEPRAH